MTQTTHLDAQRTIFPLDPVHTGIQIATLLSMMGGAILGFVGLSALASALDFSDARFLIGVVGAVVMMVAFGTLIERYLRVHWPSGRQLIVSTDAITLKERSPNLITILLVPELEQTRWYFAVPRKRGTIDKGWYCAALHLKQDDKIIVVYSFFAPSFAEQIPNWTGFEQLQSRQVAKANSKDGAEIDPQAPLRAKEEIRWQWGAEMNPDDFKQLLVHLSERD